MKVIDQALEILHEKGYLEVTGAESGKMQDLYYRVDLPDGVGGDVVSVREP